MDESTTRDLQLDLDTTADHREVAGMDEDEEAVGIFEDVHHDPRAGKCCHMLPCNVCVVPGQWAERILSSAAYMA